MKIKILDPLIGFVAALFFALVLPALLHGGLAFLGYDTLAAWFPGLMGNFAGAFLAELVLYIILSAIVFALYALTPLYKRTHGGGAGVGSASGWFFLGNLVGYCVFAVIVALALSAWHGPSL
ncbi:MAG TPA: hypothetical protein VHZ04_01510 [Candidatus Paceibacterota bacterium]|jgi:hypothetical protein|nr:hypothetical protein [Candidatus Paceibacterota bacterium]